MLSYQDKVLAWADVCSRIEPAARRPRARWLAPVWVVTAGRPRKALVALEARPMQGLPEGFYEAAGALPLRVVVASDLPRTSATVWLRLLGRGRVRAEAVADLARLPHDGWQARVLYPVVGRLRTRIRWSRRSGGRSEEAVMKNALQWYEAEKRQLSEEAERRVLLRQLAARFGELPAEVTDRIRAADASQLERWTERVLTASTLDEVVAGG